MDLENKVLDYRRFIELTFPVRIPVERKIWTLNKKECLDTIGLRTGSMSQYPSWRSLYHEV